jgi:hypothetical protein
MFGRQAFSGAPFPVAPSTPERKSFRRPVLFHVEVLFHPPVLFHPIVS